MTTSIVILTYNNLEYTKECIDSIRKYTPQGTYEIIIVDNHSNDGTIEWLKRQEDLLLILNDSNHGFPGGCNQGIVASSGSEILLLNNDTVVTENWLDNLRTALYSHEKIGAVSCVTNSCSYGQAIEVPYSNSADMQRFAAAYNQSDPMLWEERLKLVGFCMLIKKSVVDEIGMLDEIFNPGNYEDDDYSLRIRKAGYKLLLCNDTFIHHYGSVSFGKDAKQYTNINMVNTEKFNNKWGFDPNYSQHIREDIVNLIQEPWDKALRILEVGCSCGGTLLKLKHKFPNSKLYGVELNSSAAEVASLIAEVKSFNIEEEKSLSYYKEQSFDYIIFADVLEHLVDPWKIVEKMKSLLKPGGYFVASLSNIMHYSVLKDLLMNGSWNYADAGILDRTHMRFFTYESIREMFLSRGYTDLIVQGSVLPKSADDNAFLKTLSNFVSGPILQQSEFYQYILRVKNSNLDEMLRSSSNVIDNIDKDTLFNQFNDYNHEEVIHASKGIPVQDRVKLLNSLGVVNFENGKLDAVVPMFEEAITIDSNNEEVLYNLSYFLSFVGETELHVEYMERLRSVNKDMHAKLYEVLYV